jgi:hypothetical protein
MRADKTAPRRELVQCVRVGFQVRERRACRVIPVHRSSYRCRRVARDQPALRMRRRELAATRARYGYHRLHIVPQREGWRVNDKRVCRVYQLEGLLLRLQSRRKRPSHLRGRYQWLRPHTSTGVSIASARAAPTGGAAARSREWIT